MNQEELNLGRISSRPSGEPTTVEDYTFEPIRGQPMLRWAGKRPFASTQYFPAQEKERFGTDVDGWMNQIYWGDNLQVMSHLLKKYRGKVDLVYIDPPFDSKAVYKKEIKEASCITVGLFDTDSGVKRCEHGARSAECLQRAA